MNNPSLEDMLKFIDDLCIEDKMYFRVPYYYMEGSIEITYYSNNRKWVVSSPEVGVTSSMPHQELPAFLTTRYVNTGEFEVALAHTILTQATYAHMLLRKADHLFGEDIVERALAEHAKFRDELVSAVESILRPKPRLVKDTLGE